MKKIRFYLDENVGNAVARGLKKQGIDVITTGEAGRLSTPDEEQIAFATADERVVFTQDKDFLIMHSAGQEHAGIAYARLGISVGDAIRGLVLIHELLEPEEMRNKVEYL